MNDVDGFRLLLKVHIGKKLNTERESLLVQFDNRQVTIRPDPSNHALNETTWIVLDARGFPTKEEARDYGSRLRNAVYVAAICSRLGADPGKDETRSWFNEKLLRSQGSLPTHIRLVPDRHGLVILPDDGNNVSLQAGPVQVTLRSDPTQFMSALASLSDPLALAEVETPIRFLNLAIMYDDRIAQIVLANSAIESLLDHPNWNEDQKAYIDTLAAQVERECPGNSDYQQVAGAIRRIRHTSVRQGAKQLLNDEALFKKWDGLYKKRSRLFHGVNPKSESKPFTREEINQLASDTVRLCSRIILIHLRRKGINLPEVTTRHFASL